MVVMLSIGDLARLCGVSPRTLRHYDDVGVLHPARVDPATGYRWYAFHQLAELRRVIALRELGIGLDRIRGVLDLEGGVSIDQMRGMLRLREAEITQTLEFERERLGRVSALLEALERGDMMKTIDIVVKTSDPIRIVETTDRAGGYGNVHIGPIFDAKLPLLFGRLASNGLKPGICVASYDWPDDDGSVVVHVGLVIDDQPLTDDADSSIVELAGVEVASALHRGSMASIGETFEAVLRWIDTAGYRIVGRSRELYLVWTPDRPADSITEIQIPIER